ncbi:MAG: diacylglycerol kinase [Gammaproteobacteria bacterium]|nr:diacylglycerol kinase [Gammaproteobacteria bacterium]MBU1655560.1 diacylglycerol kinase [Gammaproteobacteria bacterium]MBU1960257.1 diacylglycerol kinase [Gammaproteobacteria bacterium]
MGGVHHNNRGMKRLAHAYSYSMAGFRACFLHEEAFRQEIFALIILIPLGILLGNSPVERALLVSSLLIVPIAELLNSGIEATIDRIGMEKHELSGRAKDIGSAAVFLSIVLVLVVWGLMLIPRLF